MPPIVPSRTSSTPSTLAGSDPVPCAPWCVDETGHSAGDYSGAGHTPADHASAGHTADQPAGAFDGRRCRSTVHRIDSPLGGGRGSDQTATAPAGIHLQAERAAGQPPTYVLGIELGGSEQWLRLRPADLHALVTAARTFLGGPVRCNRIGG